MEGTSRSEVNQLLSSIPEYIQKVHCDTTNKTLPFKCAVISCPNEFVRFEDRNTYPYKFHNFPFNVKLRKVWKINCGLEKTDHVKGLMVCSDHFELDSYIRNYKEEFLNPNFKRKLKDDAVPKNKLGSIKNVVSVGDVSDTDYDDLESPQSAQAVTANVLSAFPKEHHELINEFEVKTGPLDYNEVKKEVDNCLKLSIKKVELERELKRMKSHVLNWDKKLKRAKQKISFVKNKSSTELKVLKRVFSDAQINLLLGKRAIWTNDDLARAFTLRHMGTKKCYLYLKNTLKIPLPSLSCVQRWASSYE